MLLGKDLGALLMGVDLVKDRDSKAPADDLAEAVLYGCLDRGLSLKTSMGNIVTLTPPLTIAEGEMHAALDILEAALKDAHRSGPGDGVGPMA